MKKKIKTLFVFTLIALMFFSVAACKKNSQSTSASGNVSGSVDVISNVKGSVMLYATLKEAQLMALKDAFNARYPNIKLDYYAAGAGTVMTKIATEQQAGLNGADIVWVGEPTNMMTLKDQGILLPYESPEAVNVPEEYRDEDNMYIGARLVVMGIAYNTERVRGANIPEKWEDLFNSYFYNEIVLTDAVESGTMAYALGALVQNDKYGWPFFEGLKAQKAVLNSSATGTHNDIAAGGYMITIGVDYVTQTLANAGSPIAFVYPEDAVIISGPMAIMKNSPNTEAAKIFYDWVLSKEGQQVLADAGATPIRRDVTRPGSVAVDEIDAMQDVDDVLMNAMTDSYFDKFDALFKK